jgi:hypothetical protein
MLSELFSKADFSAQERRRMAESGVAMSDGSFPIKNRADLENAIQSVGRAKDYEAARRHIISRAKALRLDNMLPEEWNTRKSWGNLFQPKFSK